jgi:hypothetical protein
MPDDGVNSDVVKPSTGADSLSSEGASSTEQVVASDKDLEQAVDQAVAEVRRAVDDQADSRSPEQTSAGNDTGSAATPAVDRPIDASDMDHASPDTGEQQRSV